VALTAQTSSDDAFGQASRSPNWQRIRGRKLHLPLLQARYSDRCRDRGTRHDRSSSGSGITGGPTATSKAKPVASAIPRPYKRLMLDPDPAGQLAIGHRLSLFRCRVTLSWSQGGARASCITALRTSDAPCLKHAGGASMLLPRERDSTSQRRSQQENVMNSSVKKRLEYWNHFESERRYQQTIRGNTGISCEFTDSCN
jgi:hypothetical protein